MLDNVFILDRNKKVVATLSLKGSNPFFDFSYKEYLETGASTFDFSIVLNDELSECVTERNFVLFKRNNKLKMFQIMTCQDEEHIDNVIRIVSSETIGLELTNSYVRETNFEGNVKKFLEVILQDTNYEIGEVSETLEDEIRTVNITEPTSVYELIQNAIDIYNNVEFEFDVKCIDSVNGDYKLLVNCYADGERGTKKYRRFDYDFNAYGMSRSGDATDFCSGLIGVGANGITFKDIEWRKGVGDPLDKPLGQDFLLDPKAHEMFSNGDRYILGKYSSNATSAIDLLWETYYKLQEVKQVKYSYEVPVYLTEEEYEDVEIGDTNYIVNDKFNPPLQLEARVNEFEITDTQSILTFANYKEVKSRIQDLNKNSLVTKLSEAEILALQQYLSQLDINQAEIDRILKDLINNIDDIVDIVEDDSKETTDKEEEPIVPSADKENYKAIKLSKVDNGLFLGDGRIRRIKTEKVANITVETKEEVTTTTVVSNSKVSQQYQDAVDYYAKFNLGTKKNNSTLANIMSSSNKYKIPTLVKYWCKKFGLDTRLVYAMIMAESEGDPYNKTKSDGGGYGLMQCERSCYFNKKQTIKFIDGTTKTFTPSYNTMNPDKGITTTISGVKVNQNISNQIMFGCHELRQRAEDNHFNVFATLMGYNFGQGGVYWCVCQYIKDKYGYSIVSGRTISKQSSKVKEKYYAILDTYKAPFASYRKAYVNTWNAGTATNIEYYLRWYKPYNGSLPYFLDKDGNKLGYGAIVPSKSVEDNTATGNEVRELIVEMAKRIVSDHVDKKKATYNQVPRTIDYTKPKKWSGTHYGIKNPVVYDCSSFVSCCYLHAGLNSVYNGGCYAGTLVTGATKKSGYKMWKADADGIKQAKPGDIVMGCNYKVTDSNCTKGNWTGVGRTHHTMIYIGDGQVAHARKWDYHPRAIRFNKLTDLDDYKAGKMFFLRPYDLVEADKVVTSKESTGAEDEVIVDTKTVIKKETISEVTLKGLHDATPSDYYDDNSLVYNVTIGDATDSVKFPSSAPYVFLHFGHTCLDDYNSYINLIKILQAKYPKKPIFVAKEYKATSAKSDYQTFNEKVDVFNSHIQDYCNKTKYVIFLNVMGDMVDNNYVILSKHTSGGSNIIADSIDEYYANVKKAILAKSKGQTITSTSTTVTLTAQDKKIHKYTKPIKKFTLKVKSTVRDDFYSRIMFTTADTIKFTQPNELYLNGDNCKKGAFTPKKNVSYVINIFKNVDTELTKKKYYGSVTAQYTKKVTSKTGTVSADALNVRKGASTNYKILGTLKKNTKVTIVATASNGWYKIKYKDGYGYVSNKYITNVKDVTSTETDYTNYSNFKGRDTIVKNAKSFLENKDKFVYNNTCAFDYSNPKSNVDKWKTGSKIHIDDNFLIQLLVMGYSYNDVKDFEEKTNRKKKSDVAWALAYINNEANILKYFVQEGWILDDVDIDKFSNIEKGDILFYDTDDVDNNEYMSCSHTAICIGVEDGVNYMIETNSEKVIRKIAIKDRGANNLLAVGRINLDK